MDRAKPPLLSEPESGGADAAQFELDRGLAEPIFLREVNGWLPRWQRMLFRILVPVPLLARYGIDPIRLTDRSGQSIASVHQAADGVGIRLELRHAHDAGEPMAEIEMADTVFNQIEVLWVTLQEPFAPRYDIDRMPSGESTLRGTAGRNLAAEEAALAAGLAPGQVRRGLGNFGWLVDRLDTFMMCLNQGQYVLQPLYYHTAILFERSGFEYIQGQTTMQEIAAGFAAGRPLRMRLRGQNAFRQPHLADTIIGRSWAIHDGILDKPWDRVRMVRRVGDPAGADTCPGIPWK